MLEERVAVVVAHPDDETVGCAGLLCRLKDVRVIVVSNGALAKDAETRGFSVGQYAAVRSAELHAACGLAGIPADRVVELGLPDQGIVRQLVPLIRQLAIMFRNRRIRWVVTHAFEGGHPDHDATCFAAATAARLLDIPPNIVEAPFYRLGDDGQPLLQSFADQTGVQVLELNESERAIKRRMIEAHASQKSVIGSFGIETELYRPMPVHRFAEPPNAGRLLYERHGWFTAAEWRRQVEAILRELGQWP